jgi:hypothetical protein
VEATIERRFAEIQRDSGRYLGNPFVLLVGELDGEGEAFREIFASWGYKVLEVLCSSPWSRPASSKICRMRVA